MNGAMKGFEIFLSAFGYDSVKILPLVFSKFSCMLSGVSASPGLGMLLTMYCFFHKSSFQRSAELELGFTP